MMDRIDRVQLAVHSAEKAAETFNRLLGTEVARQDTSAFLGARRTILAMGESELELCEADGAGLTQDFLGKRGEGLMRGGISTHDMAALKAHIGGLGFAVHEDGAQFYLDGKDHFGVPLVISPSAPRRRVGPVSFLYEFTNTLKSDWRQAAAHFAGLFRLEAQRFHGIASERWGYEGTLTLFDPPNRLDRIELSQVVKADVPMARYVAKHGDSLNMCYCESHDFEGLVDRFLGAGARCTPRGPSMETEKDNFWSHPGDLHGLLLGVSRSTVGWSWSGRPEAVDPPLTEA
ncbi:MAG: hypothetical protein EP347_10760 [Alphaproteobacteria bacterium]|nr:MAG: hypothetical protein EP347_10760 [Alphaproteobacteria bacterium]